MITILLRALIEVVLVNHRAIDHQIERLQKRTHQEIAHRIQAEVAAQKREITNSDLC